MIPLAVEVEVVPMAEASGEPVGIKRKLAAIEAARSAAWSFLHE
jgi:hypothetical protein